MPSYPVGANRPMRRSPATPAARGDAPRRLRTGKPAAASGRARRRHVLRHSRLREPLRVTARPRARCVGTARPGNQDGMPGPVRRARAEPAQSPRSPRGRRHRRGAARLTRAPARGWARAVPPLFREPHARLASHGHGLLLDPRLRAPASQDPARGRHGRKGRGSPRGRSEGWNACPPARCLPGCRAASRRRSRNERDRSGAPARSHRVAARTPEELHRALGPALDRVSAENARAYFRHCGYDRPD